MKKYSKEIKAAALVLAGLTFLSCITAFVFSQVSDFWGDGGGKETPIGLEFLEKNQDQFVKRKKLIEIIDVYSGMNAGLADICFADRALGLVCGENGTAALTIDGGKKWTKFQEIDPSANFTGCYISIDKKIFIIDEEGNLRFSYDLGKSWRIMKLENNFIPLSIKFFNNGAAFITGSNGTILRSSDNGKNWKKTVSPVKNIIYDADFRDEKNGIAVGTDGILLKTSDGGNNWLPEKGFFKDYLKRIKYINGSKWIAVGAEGSVFITSSNGDDWERKNIPEGEAFRSIAVINEEDMIIADSKGAIYMTKDAGDTWRKLGQIDDMRLTGLARQSKDEFMAAGEGGRIKKIIIK